MTDFRAAVTEVVRATSRFSFILWVPEMRRRKGDLAGLLPRPNTEGEIRRGSTGAERARVSDTLELGLGSRGTQRTWLLRQGKASGWPLERGFAGFKTSPGERNSTSLTTTSLPRESGKCHMSFLPRPAFSCQPPPDSPFLTITHTFLLKILIRIYLLKRSNSTC